MTLIHPSLHFVIQLTASYIIVFLICSTHQDNVCLVQWNNFTNVHSFGAVYLSEVKSSADCLNFCLLNLTCVAVEIDKNFSPIKCWMYDDVSKVSDKYDLSGVDQYVLGTRCSVLYTSTSQSTCLPVWNQLVNRLSFGGIRYTLATTVNECQSACISNLSCLAVDVDRNVSPVQCYLHTSPNSETFSANGVDHYILSQRCSMDSSSSSTATPCTLQWNTLTNTNSFGATQYTEYTTVDSCLNFCLSLSQCVAVDINNSSGSGVIQCWLHNSSANIVNKNSFVGINQYVLVNRCSTGASGSTASSFTLATSSETSIKAATATSCTPQWNNLANTNSFGATQYTEYTTVDSCLNFCLSLSQCVAVDINNSSSSGAIQCWLHNSSANIVNKNSFVGINQYVLVNRCSNLAATSSVFPATTSTAKPACMPSWMTKPMTHSLGGSFYSNCSSQAKCLQCCLAIPTCVGIDLDSFFVPAQCFIYTNSMAFTSSQQASTTVTQYQLINRCASQIACNSPGYRYCKNLNQCFPSSSFCDGIPDCSDSSDELGCTSVCASNEFSCSGSLCLLNTFWCNGFVNCPDGSDEPLNCRPSCSPSSFHCADGFTCIGIDQVCDGYSSCPDGSDERNCPTVCPIDQFSCSNGVCRNVSSWCNNLRECNDNSDEPVNCQTSCPPGYVRCSSATSLSGGVGCIPAGRWCDGFSVDCSDGSDEASRCVCQDNSHRCPHGCISQNLVCDGLLQCSDGSDETNCPCSSGNFKCGNGACVSNSFVCDGQNNCGDLSDEFVCGVCNQLEFSCSSLCLNRSTVCDGFIDCPNGEDEQNCSYSECGPGQFSCDSGRCLSDDLLCNNIFNCLDLSDELNCSNTCLANRGVPCDNGLCVLPYQWCDGRVDCLDSSDEKICTCAAPNFKCWDGLCLLPTQRCNGVFDCAEREDEFNCTCSQFQCPRSLCISKSVQCDGVKDCPDGSDETGCGNSCNAITQFQCAVDFQCINISLKCNGVDDCTDASDERSCLSMYVSSAELSIEPLLVDPSSPASLVVKYSGSRSYRVCFDTWSSSWSDLACQQLGYIRSNLTSSETNIRSYQTLVLRSSSAAVVGSNLLSSLVIGSCASNRYVLLNCVVKRCGKRIVGENLLDTYIDNGATAGAGSLPWHVAIYRDAGFFCSGSLVDEIWILTSAQCLLSSNSLQIADVSRFSVRLGSVHLSSYDAGLQIRYPDRFLIHPRFNNFTHEPDVGLMRLSKPVQLTTSVNPVCLSTNRTTISHFQVCLTSGWVRQSLLQGERNVGETLTQMRTSVLSSSQCLQLLRQSRNSFIPNEISMLCGRSAVLPSNFSCLTDLGRPWVCKDDTNTWTQIGLVTGDTSCGGVTLSTKLSTYYDWIEGVLGA